MLTLEFTTKWPQVDYPADVHVITVEQALQWAPEGDCRTLYVTCEIEREQLYLVTGWMVKGGLVVICKLANVVEEGQKRAAEPESLGSSG